MPASTGREPGLIATVDHDRTGQRPNFLTFVLDELLLTHHTSFPF